MKVYVCTSGIYSDYGIEAVFSTEEKAKEYCLTVSYDPDYIEYEIDVPFEIFDYIDVKMDKSGEHSDTATRGKNREKTINPIQLIDHHKNSRTMSSRVYTTDEKKAIKVTNERRAIIITEGIWDNEPNQYTASRRANELFTKGEEELNESKV